MLQIGDLLLNNVRKFPDRTAIVSRYRELTYLELNRESNCLANALKKRGLTKGDAAAILLKNSVDWCVAWFACQKLGVIFVPLHIRLRVSDMLDTMGMVDCKVLIFEDRLENQAKEICKKYEGLKLAVCTEKIESEGFVFWEDLMAEADYSEAQVTLDNDDPSVLLCTSGTTGKPKGVLRTQEMVVLHAVTLALKNNSPWLNDVMMSTSPLFHIGGLQGFLKMVMVGGTYITLDRIDPDEVMDMIEKRHVTQLQMLPPVTYERIFKHDGWKNRDRSSVWEVCISAGKCTNEYIEHVFEMFPNSHLRPSWGSTETCSVTCTQIIREEYEADRNLVKAVGEVMPFTQVRIVDENGNDVVPGESGEALVSSPMVLKEYIHAEKVETEDIFVDGKWFKTGDIMRMDPETGYYYFLDRKKDVIKTGGECVFALEVERVLQEHPNVQDCAVIGVPDDDFGEGIAAAIVEKVKGSVQAKELVEFCKERLPSFKKPRYLAYLDKLPVNDIGKIAKPVLRENAETLFTPIF